MATVTVRFFGPARSLTDKDADSIELAVGDTVGSLAGKLAVKFPRLGQAVGLRLAVNRQYVAMDHLLQAGDEIAVIPPVSGGAPIEPVRLIHGSLDIAAILSAQTPQGAGAACQFVGTVRPENGDGKTLEALDYSAYEEMALEQMRAVRQRAIAKFDLIDAVIVHRLGRVNLGEASILVATWSGHRAESFESCRWIVDAVKVDVPIWKKDIWADGSTSWVEPQA